MASTSKQYRSHAADPPALMKKIGQTTYRVWAHFSTTSTETMEDKIKRLRSLRPMDDDFMRCLFKDNIPLAEMVLRILTGKPDLVITDCQTQKDMSGWLGHKLFR